MSSLGPLSDGSRVIVLGGGPGGTSTALALKQVARQMGRRIDVQIIEGKIFAGERNHNLSVGVLSPPLPELMERQLDLPFPRHLATAEIEGYVLHSPHNAVALEDTGERGIAVRRVQWDDHMLESARERGVKVIQARFVDVDFGTGGVVVYTDLDTYEADVLVGAFGLDDGAGAIFSRITRYVPPPAMTSVLTKYDPGPEGMARIGNWVHAFLPSYGGIEFGAVTPKGDHITVNVAGRRVGAASLERFLAHPEVRAALPNYDRAVGQAGNGPRFFKGRFPNSLAGHYYGDRYVMVGDAAGLVRAFKGKGVTTAVQTGIRAAESIMRTGISETAFAADYAVANRDITDDLIYGRVMRFLVAWSARWGLIDPVVRAAQRDHHVHEGLFGAVSAHAPYRQVLLEMIDPHAVRAVLGALVHRSEPIRHPDAVHS